MNEAPLASKTVIVYEHDDFYITLKPEGIEVHSSGSSEESFITCFRQQMQNQALFPCHRLDKVTSGLLLVAKGEKANASLSVLFQQRKVEKYYLALSSKKPRKKQGMVKGDMQPARSGSWKLLRSHKNPAITQFFSTSIGDGLRLSILKPYTGKTHQLRVAMKSLGAPILGDLRYGGAPAKRCYLHAAGLSFIYKNKPYNFLQLPTFQSAIPSGLNSEQLESFLPFCELPWPTFSE